MARTWKAWASTGELWRELLWPCLGLAICILSLICGCGAEVAVEPAEAEVAPVEWPSRPTAKYRLEIRGMEPAEQAAAVEGILGWGMAGVEFSGPPEARLIVVEGTVPGSGAYADPVSWHALVSVGREPLEDMSMAAAHEIGHLLCWDGELGTELPPSHLPDSSEGVMAATSDLVTQEDVDWLRGCRPDIDAGMAEQGL